MSNATISVHRDLGWLDDGRMATSVEIGGALRHFWYGNITSFCITRFELRTTRTEQTQYARVRQASAPNEATFDH